MGEPETYPGAFGPVNACCGVTASAGHGLYCENRIEPDVSGSPYGRGDVSGFMAEAGRYAPGGVVPERPQPVDDLYRAMGFEPPVLRVDVDDEGVSHVSEVESARPVTEGFGIGQVVPESFTAAVDQQFRAELVRREAEARAALTERVAEAIANADNGVDPIPWDELSDFGKDQRREVAAAAVEVFAEWVREGLGRPESGPWATWGGDGVGP